MALSRIELLETIAFLKEALEGRPATVDDARRLLLAKFGVARTDALLHTTLAHVLATVTIGDVLQLAGEEG